jgi:hypothetical protein
MEISLIQLDEMHLAQPAQRLHVAWLQYGSLAQPRAQVVR